MHHLTRFIRDPVSILRSVSIFLALGILGCANPRFNTQSDDTSVRPEIAIPTVTPTQVIDHLIAAKESRGCKVESRTSNKVVIVCVEDRSKQSFGSWIASILNP